MSKKDDSNINSIRGVIIIISGDTNPKPLGFKIYELTPEDCAERDSPENSAIRKKEREAVDIADQYLSDYGIDYKKPSGFSYTSLEVLKELWGTPWNNAAANFLHCLRPSSVRVTTGTITLDAQSWRVTVYLEEDERTIRKIEQSVDVGIVGFRNGEDASDYLRGHYHFLEEPQPIGFINPRGIAKMEIKTDEST